MLKILQEVGLAKDPRILYGEVDFSYRDFMRTKSDRALRFPFTLSTRTSSIGHWIGNVQLRTQTESSLACLTTQDDLGVASIGIISMHFCDIPSVSWAMEAELSSHQTT